jgi:hypothetical protein
MGDLERVEEGEGLGLAALEVEREGRSRAGAVAPVDVGLPRVAALREEAEIADALDLGMVAKEAADLRSSIQAVFGSVIVPMVLRSIRIWLISAFDPVIPPATRSLCPPAYLVSE